MLQPGTILDGRYEILSRIATGGMGEVFKARRTRLGDEVAIKVVHISDDNTAADIRRSFMQEGPNCAALRHPNIVSVLDFGIDFDAGLYLAMEFLNGPNLAQQIASAGPLPVELVCRIVTELASAIDLAHARGVVHRDLKPSNIVMHRYDSGEMVYKIIDFGISALQRAVDATTRKNAPATMAGSLLYSSPEQLTGKEVDGRSDIYSLGVVTFNMLTGRRPFEHEDMATLLANQLTADAVRPSALRRGLPHHIDDAVMKALDKNPSARWSTTAAFAQALEGAQNPEPTPAGPDRAALRDRYEVGALLEGGRLGSDVYAGTARGTGRPVAIRILRRSANRPWEVARNRFLREAHATQIDHPSILQVRDFGEEADLAYVVTDLVAGVSLREALERDGLFSWSRAHGFIDELVSAVGALHQHGQLIYGLTSNIVRIVGGPAQERLMVSSAGIAEVQDALAGVSHQAVRGLKVQDTDLLYVAPEVLIGEKADGRTDIYNVGVIAYEMVTGERPFSAATVPQLTAQLFSSRPKDPAALNVDLPRLVADVILRCLALRPDQRFTDAGELGSMLATMPKPTR